MTSVLRSGPRPVLPPSRARCEPRTRLRRDRHATEPRLEEGLSTKTVDKSWSEGASGLIFQGLKDCSVLGQNPLHPRGAPDSSVPRRLPGAGEGGASRPRSTRHRAFGHRPRNHREAPPAGIGLRGVPDRPGARAGRVTSDEVAPGLHENVARRSNGEEALPLIRHTACDAWPLPDSRAERVALSRPAPLHQERRPISASNWIHRVATARQGR